MILLQLKFTCSHTQVEPKLATVLFATDSNPQLCALLKTALLNQQDVHIVGWNLRRTGKGKVLLHGNSRDVVQITPLIVSSYVCSLDKEMTVLGSDAYDTLFSSQSTPHNILNAFNTLESEFLWSAESNMWPSFSSLPSHVAKFYHLRKHASPYRFLNYGGWIGKAQTACEVLKLCARQLLNCSLCRCTRRRKCKSPNQDQGAAHIVYTSKWFRYKMLLDHHQVIFHPAYPRCARLRVSQSGNVHVENISDFTHMYHFNGASKYRSGCKGYYKFGWFRALGKPSSFNDSVTFVGNKNEKYVRSVTKICPYMWQNFTWIEPSEEKSQTRWRIKIKEKVFEG